MQRRPFKPSAAARESLASQRLLGRAIPAEWAWVGDSRELLAASGHDEAVAAAMDALVNGWAETEIVNTFRMFRMFFD